MTRHFDFALIDDGKRTHVGVHLHYTPLGMRRAILRLAFYTLPAPPLTG